MAELSTLGSVIKTAYEGEADTNAFTDAEKAKLAGVASGATNVALASTAPAALASAAAAGVGTTAARADHVHAFPAQIATARNFSLSGDVTAAAVSFNGSANVTLATAIGAGVIVDADVSASAAIAVSKLSGLAAAVESAVAAKTEVAALTPIATPASATAEECATAINAIIAALKA